MRGTCRILLCALALGLWLGPTGASGTDDASAMEKLLDTLLEAGTLSPAQYRSLHGLAESEARTQRLAAVEKQAADSKQWKILWHNGTEISRADGAFKLKLGGRIFLDFAAVDAGPGINSVIPGVTGTGVQFRKARLYVQGTLFDRVIFKSQYEFAGSSTGLGDSKTNFKDLYLGLIRVPVLGTVRVGHFKEPFGLEELTSTKYTTFMERNLSNLLTPGRNTGISAHNTLAGERMTWSVGGFRDVGNSGGSFSKGQLYNVTARLTGLPVADPSGEHLLHLGAAYSHQFRDGASLRFRQRPELALTQNLVDTGSVATQDLDRFGAELAAVFGPASVQSELNYARVDIGKHADLWGTYVEASYFLTGEHRAYNRRAGAFGRVKPRRNFDPARGDFGALQVAARYSILDLGEVGNGAAIRDLTAGLNWLLYPNVRIMTDYIHSRLSGSHANEFGMRFQLDY